VSYNLNNLTNQIGKKKQHISMQFSCSNNVDITTAAARLVQPLARSAITRREGLGSLLARVETLRRQVRCRLRGASRRLRLLLSQSTATFRLR